MAHKPTSAADVIARIENQAAPAKAWSYTAPLGNGQRQLSHITFGMRREVIAFLEDEFRCPWSELHAAGFEVVKVTVYEGWAN